MLRFWNTASRQLEDFVPLKDKKVGLYTCGPTVYWTAHIGNFRSYVFEDVLQRVLEANGYSVTRVMNITDVGHLVGDGDEGEDKLIVGALREGKTVYEIAEMYTQRFFEDAAKLNIHIPPAPFLCKATDHIPEQIELVQTLEKKGFTYRTSDGIYFDTSKFPAYGALSGQRLDEKEEGARVVVNVEKRNKTDFALWKFSYPSVILAQAGIQSADILDSRLHGNDKVETPKRRLMEWESPWGVGFPGWHIECSAMSRKYLGQPFDIHCGGIDHISVHHENEIAQSEAAYGVKLANYWMHNEFLTIDGQKMSKSLGNVYTVLDVLSRGFDPLALRFFYLGAQYHQKENFTWEALQASQNALQKLRHAIQSWDQPTTISPELETEFRDALGDDLNTPKALAVVWKLVDSDLTTGVKSATISAMDSMLGLSLTEYIGKRVEVSPEVQQLLDERQTAREKKDWTVSDGLRKKIEEVGFTVEDTAQGQKVWPK